MPDPPAASPAGGGSPARVLATPRAPARRRTTRTASAASAPRRRVRIVLGLVDRRVEVHVPSGTLDIGWTSSACTWPAARRPPRSPAPASPSPPAARQARPRRCRPTARAGARRRPRSPPRPRGHDLAPPGHEADREPRHRRREHDVEAEDRGVGDRAAELVAGDRREVPRDEHPEHRADPVARHVDPADPAEVGAASANASSVRTWAIAARWRKERGGAAGRATRCTAGGGR